MFNIHFNGVKKVLVAAAVTVTLGGVSSYGISAPSALAAGVSKGAGVFAASNDTTLKAIAKNGIAASPNQAVTQQGVKLTLTDLAVDGAKIVAGIKQEGTKLTKEGAFLDNTRIMEVLIDGKSATFDIMTNQEKDSALFYLQEGKVKQVIPDSFKLTLRVYVKGVPEPFEFNTQADKLRLLLDLKPGVSKKNSNFSYTVTGFQMSPLTMSLKLNFKGVHPATARSKAGSQNMLYELVDDKGNISPSLNIIDKKVLTSGSEVQHYAAFPAVPKSISIKPYTFSFNARGEFIRDSKGQAIKTYYKDLESKFTVK
ncbi:DUF4179 domain-containing protein [Paenibacillus piscarius]|uniref:DUF4179 domain-containing protein n=1 Tax=Paenibacillus piscarius TaxID=1089681 RepID=UPI001EE849BB|nr:DUF4179 domain-containing protein [Paenibacillus piscarius]